MKPFGTTAPFQPAAPAWPPGRAPAIRALTLGTGGGVVPSVPFALTQLPAGSVIDHDPAVNLTVDGSNNVTSWAAALGSGTFTPTGTPKRDLAASDGLPRVTFSGVDGGPTLAGDEAHFEKWSDFLVVERPATNQNAVATNKTFYSAPRASDGANTSAWMLRLTNDAEQDDVILSGIGTGSTTASGVFPLSSRRMLRLDRFTSSRIVIDGTTGPTVVGSAAGSSTQTILGGSLSSSSAKAAISYLRRLRVNTDALPGKHEQLYNLWVIEALLALKYGRTLPVAHPFFGRAPVAADWTGKNHCWGSWGNSIMLGAAGGLPSALNATAKGITTTNGGVGGQTSTQIKARFDAGFDIGIGLSTAGITTTDQRRKIVQIGDLAENNAGASIPTATMLSELADMVAAIEAAQGVAAGQARLIVWGRWRGNGEPGTDSRIPSNDATSDTIQALYPNYFINMGKELAKLAAPGQLYADADAFARGVISTALRAGGGDLLHLNATGYSEAAKIAVALAGTKGFLLP